MARSGRRAPRSPGNRRSGVVAGERRDEGVASGSPRQRQAGQLQPRRPALGPTLQPHDVGVVEVELERAVQQAAASSSVNRRSARGSQRSRAGPEPPSGNGGSERLAMAIEPSPGMIEEECERFVDLRVDDQVIVVEHEHEVQGSATSSLMSDGARPPSGWRDPRASRAAALRCGLDRAERPDHALPEANLVVSSGRARASRRALAAGVARHSLKRVIFPTRPAHGSEPGAHRRPQDPRDQAIAAASPSVRGNLQFGFGEHGSGGKDAALLSSPGADSIARPGSSAFTRFGMISSMSPNHYQAVLTPVAVRVP